MLKSLAAAGILVLAFSGQAFADEMMMECNDASMMKLDEAMKADTDPAMKNDVDMAMKEVDMAKEAMAAHKMDDCSMHLGEAAKHMMMKQ